MDRKVKYIGIRGSSCVGCQNNNADIMLTLQSQEDKEERIWHDWFLSYEDAEFLYQEIRRELKNNGRLKL